MAAKNPRQRAIYYPGSRHLFSGAELFFGQK
jgi:hypothetical protein